MNYLLALDQGTSSTRAMLYTSKGILVKSCQYPVNVSHPKPSWVEQDPEELWSKSLQAMQQVTQGIQPGEILCCGITNQRETTIIWDKATGRSLAPAIVWQDRRTSEFCDSLKGESAQIRELTGLIPDAYFSASKLRWLLENHPEARDLAQKGQLAFGTVDSFLMWRLSNGAIHKTDVTNASRTMLYDINRLEWSPALLKLFDIPINALPEVVSSDAYFGVIDKQHLGFELPINGVAGDQQAALIGQVCIQPGMVKATYGTGAFIVANTGTEKVTSTSGLLTTIAYQSQGELAYAIEGSLYHAGTTIKWLRDQMHLLQSADESESLAASLSSNDGVYLVSSFTGLGAPYWMNTQGAFIDGLSQKSTPEHIVRAALEGICYQTKDVLDCIYADSKQHLSELRVDGGMAANSWFLQFLAEQCQLCVVRPIDIETTALGAALLAGVGYGLFESLQSLDGLNLRDREFKPQQPLEEVEKNYGGWQRTIKKLKTM